MEVACQNTNKQLLEDKIGKERYNKDRDTEDKLNHIDYVNNNDFYTENPVTNLLYRLLVNQCLEEIESLTITGKE